MPKQATACPHETIRPEAYALWLAQPAHPLYEVLDAYLPPTGLAVELGCGVGTGVLRLLERGLDVVAVDNDPDVLEVLKKRLPDGARAILVESRIEEFTLPACDVIVGGFCLFFLSPKEFRALWKRMRAALRPDGLFAGQLLGVGDDWQSPRYTRLTRPQVERRLVGFETLHLEEVDRDGETIDGSAKHWHIFHVIARKRG